MECGDASATQCIESDVLQKLRKGTQLSETERSELTTLFEAMDELSEPPVAFWVPLRIQLLSLKNKPVAILLENRSELVLLLEHAEQSETSSVSC